LRNQRLDRLTVLDVLLVAALIALPGWALVRSWRVVRGQPVARVSRGNRLLGVYRLDRPQTIFIGSKTRPDMKLEIRDGAIRVAESNCPKRLCMQAGWVRTPGRSIVCVPNRVVIELKGESTGYDAETY
jgi:hypothetical protein